MHFVKAYAHINQGPGIDFKSFMQVATYDNPLTAYTL
jgi:hypothetical protein